MLISQPMPSDSLIVWSVGTGWEFASPSSNLTDGRPREGCRMVRTSGSSGLVLQGNWSSASAPGLFRTIAVLGMSDSCEGRTFAIDGLSASSGLYDVSIGQFTPTRLADGSLAIIRAFTEAEATFFGSVEGISISDVSGAPPAAHTIGQVLATDADEWRIRKQWQDSTKIQSRANVTRTGQPYIYRQPQARTASVTIAPVGWDKAYIDTANDQTLDELRARLSEYQPVLAIPALYEPGTGGTGSYSTSAVNRSAVFGWAIEIGPIEMIENSSLFQMRLGFTEAPAGRIEG